MTHARRNSGRNREQSRKIRFFFPQTEHGVATEWAKNKRYSDAQEDRLAIVATRGGFHANRQDSIASGHRTTNDGRAVHYRAMPKGSVTEMNRIGPTS